MPCLSPIRIRNRRFCADSPDEVLDRLAEHPASIACQYLVVPCGRCSECLRANRNAWFVRMNREKAWSRSIGWKCHFLTITINEESYPKAIESPSAFIRDFFESYRHATGKKLKHVVFQEFGPTTGRLHFHGLVFAPDLDYRRLRAAVARLGYIWIRPTRSSDAGYCAKYVTKGIESGDPRYRDPRYRRKFVSPHFGDYLGTLPPPSETVKTWDFLDTRSGVVYRYTIPRYFRKYATPLSLKRMEFQSAVSLYALDPDPRYLGILQALEAECYPAGSPSALSPGALLSRLQKMKYLEPVRPRPRSYGDPAADLKHESASMDWSRLDFA